MEILNISFREILTRDEMPVPAQAVRDVGATPHRTHRYK